MTRAELVEALMVERFGSTSRTDRPRPDDVFQPDVEGPARQAVLVSEVEAYEREMYARNRGQQDGTVHILRETA